MHVSFINAQPMWIHFSICRYWLKLLNELPAKSQLLVLGVWINISMKHSSKSRSNTSRSNLHWRLIALDRCCKYNYHSYRLVTSARSFPAQFPPPPPPLLGDPVVLRGTGASGAADDSYQRPPPPRRDSWRSVALISKKSRAAGIHLEGGERAAAMTGTLDLPTSRSLLFLSRKKERRRKKWPWRLIVLWAGVSCACEGFFR